MNNDVSIMIYEWQNGKKGKEAVMCQYLEKHIKPHNIIDQFK